MSYRIAKLVLASALVVALTAPEAAAQNRRGGGGTRAAPTTLNSGGARYGTTPGGTHYATNGRGGAVAAGNGQWGAVGANGRTNSGNYGTTANGTRYATSKNGAVAANNGRVAAVNGRGGNVNINTVNVDNGWNNNGYTYYRPGAVVAATAVVTAAVIGSRYYALPPSCVAYTYTTAYYHCGTVWYQPQYQGSSITYIVVKQPPAYVVVVK